MPNLGTATFTATFQNDGTATDTFTILGQGTTSRYTVTYKDGATNVTAAVVAGTFQFTGVGAGQSRTLTIQIKAKAGTPVNNLVTRLVTVTGSHGEQDAVKASVKRR